MKIETLIELIQIFLDEAFKQQQSYNYQYEQEVIIPLQKYYQSIKKWRT